MENKGKTNGKEALKQILNKIVAREDGEEIIDNQVLESLLAKLDEYVSSEENQRDRFQGITPERLAMFKARYGLDGSEELKSYEEVAKRFETTEVRARQADVQVVRKLTSAGFIPRNNNDRDR